MSKTGRTGASKDLSWGGPKGWDGDGDGDGNGEGGVERMTGACADQELMWCFSEDLFGGHPQPCRSIPPGKPPQPHTHEQP